MDGKIYFLPSALDSLRWCFGFRRSLWMVPRPLPLRLSDRTGEGQRVPRSLSGFLAVFLALLPHMLPVKIFQRQRSADLLQRVPGLDPAHVCCLWLLPFLSVAFWRPALL